MASNDIVALLIARLIVVVMDTSLCCSPQQGCGSSKARRSCRQRTALPSHGSNTNSTISGPWEELVRLPLATCEHSGECTCQVVRAPVEDLGGSPVMMDRGGGGRGDGVVQGGQSHWRVPALSFFIYPSLFSRVIPSPY